MHQEFFCFPYFGNIEYMLTSFAPHELGFLLDANFSLKISGFFYMCYVSDGLVPLNTCKKGNRAVTFINLLEDHLRYRNWNARFLST